MCRISHMDKNDWPYRKYGVNRRLIQKINRLSIITLKHFIYLKHDKKKRATNPKTDANSFIFCDLRILEGYQTLLAEVLPSYVYYPGYIVLISCLSSQLLPVTLAECAK